MDAIYSCAMKRVCLLFTNELDFPETHDPDGYCLKGQDSFAILPNYGAEAVICTQGVHNCGQLVSFPLRMSDRTSRERFD